MSATPHTAAYRTRAVARRGVDIRRVRRMWDSTRVALLGVTDLTAALWASTAARTERLGRSELPQAVAGQGPRVTYEMLAICGSVAWVLLMAAAGTYRRRDRVHAWEQVAGACRAAVALLAMLAVVTMFARLQVSRSYVIMVLVLTVVVTSIGRCLIIAALHGLMRIGIQTERVVLLGGPSEVGPLRDHLRRTSGTVRVVQEIDPGVTDPDLTDTLIALGRDHGVTAVVATNDSLGDRLRDLSAELDGAGVALLVAPANREVLGPTLELQPVGDLFLLRVGTGRLRWLSRTAKGVLDRTVATVMLIVLGPVLLTIAFLVRRDGGPALFRQQRIGRHGVPFRIVKFRTMVPDAEAALRSNGLYEAYVRNGFKLPPEADPRITRIGAWLRRTSLDELPQLWNVLSGEMSLVGPRPVVPDELDCYGELRRAYLQMRPGITGYWQANGRSDVGFPERAVLDSYYYDHQSIRMDVRILLRTAWAVIRRRGAH